ncbi:uncharacterized protein LOC123535119 [Mercenaria mercenaria]|uniref:uncharacterized protein LOC123535119 n=1 Tax=Mercenaria mercenaria TaxID=6596 RepID=UPI00234EF070|nr:uncharacterized protein LOC123535119 [Mercenaria mercenaria]
MCTARVTSGQNFTIPYRISKRRRISFYIVCLTISFFLQVVGFVIPGWGHLKGDVLTFHVGLWYRVTCKKGDVCQTAPMVSSKDNDMTEYQIETSMSLVACIMAIVSLFIYMRYMKNSMITVVIIGMLASMLSGVLALLASGKMGNKYQQLHNEQMDAYGKSVYKSPYSLFLTGTGGLVTCLVFLALLVEIHIFLKGSLLQNSTIDISVRSEQTMVAVVATDTYSTEPPNEHQGHNMTTYISTSASTDESGTLPPAYETAFNARGMYARPKIKAKSCQNTSANPSDGVNVANNTEKSDVDHAEPVYGNVVLASGQHIVINDIYNM